MLRRKQLNSEVLRTDFAQQNYCRGEQGISDITRLYFEYNVQNRVGIYRQGAKYRDRVVGKLLRGTIGTGDGRFWVNWSNSKLAEDETSVGDYAWGGWSDRCPRLPDLKSVHEILDKPDYRIVAINERIESPNPALFKSRAQRNLREIWSKRKFVTRKFQNTFKITDTIKSKKSLGDHGNPGWFKIT